MTCMRSRLFGGMMAVALGASLGAARAEAPVHLALEKSAPAEDEVLSVAPSEVRLWFTEVPHAAATSIRIVAADESLVESGDPVVDGDDAKVFSATVKGKMGTGPYTVMWRAMAADGHVVRGEFGFTVSVEAKPSP